MTFLRTLVSAAHLALMLGTLTPTAFAQEDSRLDEINKQVEAETRKLKDVTSAQENLERESTNIRASLVELRTQERKLARELEAVNLERVTVEAELSSTSAELLKVNSVSLSRLRALYMNKQNDVLGSVIFTRAHAGQDIDIARNVYFLQKLRGADMELLKKLRNLKQSKEKRQGELRGLIETQGLYRRKIGQQKDDVQARFDAQEAVSTRLKVEKTRREEAISSLKAQALRLETVIASITNGASERGIQSPTGRSLTPRSASGGRFEGKGLFVLKGSLKVPVEGRVIRGYGQYRTTGYREMVQSKGMEFATSSGTSVHAIAAGRIIFQGAMASYGNIVIIDHGARYYSLYGYLANVNARKGQLVEPNDTIGYTGPPADANSTRNFYFEIRRSGESVNPATFYPRSAF